MLVVGACFRDSFLCCFSVLVLYVGFRSVGWFDWLVGLVDLVGWLVGSCSAFAIYTTIVARSAVLGGGGARK